MSFSMSKPPKTYDHTPVRLEDSCPRERNSHVPYRNHNSESIEVVGDKIMIKNVTV